MFSAAMLLFVKSQCFPFNALKTWGIHCSEFKNLTGTSQAGVETYLLPLKVKLAVQFLVTKNLAVNHLPLEAPSAVQTGEEP